jgi:3',5'-cyclic AMP phosphodiesterase CpdA
VKGGVFAVSDLHVDHPENRELLQRMRPDSSRDWLIVAGDVADGLDAVEWALRLLAERYARVIWVPGNHELLAYGDDPLRGERRYQHLMPLFLLYDYSFGRNVGATKEEALRRAHEAGVVCVDEYLLHPDPFPSREAWCADRVAVAEQRLAATDPDLPTVLINHFPLIDEPTKVLRHPEFAQWCGTVKTADWHRRYRATTVVYGHLHIPRTTWHDGVRFEEVSLGYPRERARWGDRRNPLQRQILPEAASA